MINQTAKKIKITTLVEDTSPYRNLWGEHGLSFWIEVDNKKILFDTGQSGEVLIHNLKALNFDLRSIDSFILSHPHDDHSGGLQLIVNQIKDVPMYSVSNAFNEYVPNGEKISKIISKIHYVKKDLEIFPGIYVLQERDAINTSKLTKEISLVVNLEGKGLVIIVGCAHQGLINIINNVKFFSQNKIPIYALFGGLHLKDTKEEEIIEIINSLKNSGLKILAPNHCIGFSALKMMSQTFSQEMKLTNNTSTGTFHTGKTIEL